MSKYKGYKKYEVTFTKKDKYNPITRSVNVYALNDYHAGLMVHTEFGSFSRSKENGILITVPSNKVKIENVKEIKESS